jgi:hypothetical protein
VFRDTCLCSFCVWNSYPEFVRTFQLTYIYSCVILTQVVGRLRLALSNGPHRVDLSHPPRENGNRSIFRNGLFLECRMMDNIQKPNNLECYTQSSEPRTIKSNYVQMRKDALYIICTRTFYIRHLFSAVNITLM